MTTWSPSPRRIANGAGTSSTACGATSTRPIQGAWLRQLDYYVELHRLADESLGTVLEALDESGAGDDTVVIFTSDHGDMCGSHGLRSKGPFVYEEIMRVPLYVRVPGRDAEPGRTTDALATHVDLAATICALAGLDPATAAGPSGRPDLAGGGLVAGAGRSGRRGARPRPVRAGHGA